MDEVARVRRVWKYEVPVDDHDHLIPFWPVHVAAKDNATLTAWCEVETAEGEAPTLEPFRVFGTGQPIPSGAAHHGTVLVGPFVWHLYNTAMCDVRDRRVRQADS